MYSNVCMLNHINRTIYLLILHIGIWSRQVNLLFNLSPVFSNIHIWFFNERHMAQI